MKSKVWMDSKCHANIGSLVHPRGLNVSKVDDGQVRQHITYACQIYQRSDDGTRILLRASTIYSCVQSLKAGRVSTREYIHVWKIGTVDMRTSGKSSRSIGK
jgi:hypothetical protein